MEPILDCQRPGHIAGKTTRFHSLLFGPATSFVFLAFRLSDIPPLREHPPRIPTQIYYYERSRLSLSASEAVLRNQTYFSRPIFTRLFFRFLNWVTTAWNGNLMVTRGNKCIATEMGIVRVRAGTLHSGRWGFCISALSVLATILREASGTLQ